jgi:hypothetical protein
MHTFLRRFLLLIAFAFWQGGFTFYAAVVVPVATEALGSAKEQGFITRRVARYINLAGAAALALFVWDMAAARDPARWRRRLRWLAWLVMAGCLALLVWLHPRLDERMVGAEVDTYRIVDRRSFRQEHRWYLWISTAQWGSGIVYLVLTIQGWRRTDSSPTR